MKGNKQRGTVKACKSTWAQDGRFAIDCIPIPLDMTLPPMPAAPAPTPPPPVPIIIPPPPTLPSMPMPARPRVEQDGYKTNILKCKGEYHATLGTDKPVRHTVTRTHHAHAANGVGGRRGTTVVAHQQLLKHVVNLVVHNRREVKDVVVGRVERISAAAYVHAERVSGKWGEEGGSLETPGIQADRQKNKQSRHSETSLACRDHAKNKAGMQTTKHHDDGKSITSRHVVNAELAEDVGQFALLRH